MDLDLFGRVILVVGGTGLLGSAIVDRLTAEAATVVVGSRTISPERGVVIDGRDDESVTRAIASVLADHGRLDGLVVAAAPSAQTLDPARNNHPDQVIEAIDAKAMSFLRIAQAALPAMRAAGYGRVVGISGQNAWLTGNITGAVRNAALILAAKTLADEAAGSGVTVNTVNPGPVVVSEPSTEIAVGGVGQSLPANTADLVAFLCSPLAGAISGEAIAVGHRSRGAGRI